MARLLDFLTFIGSGDTCYCGMSAFSLLPFSSNCTENCYCANSYTIDTFAHAYYESEKGINFNLDPELFCACRGERSRALGNPGERLSLIGFSKKQLKCFWLFHSSLHELERLNVRRLWRVSGFFPRNVDVNKTGRFLISAIPKQHLHD